jgi:hypothetical protein
VIPKEQVNARLIAPVVVAMGNDGIRVVEQSAPADDWHIEDATFEHYLTRRLRAGDSTMGILMRRC